MHLLRHLMLSFVLWLSLDQTFAADFKEIEQDISDSVITAKITAKITKNKDLNPLKLSVTTLEGVVSLNGHVKDKEAFMQALQLVTATKGVKSVDTDNLIIKRVNTVFTDTYITAKVEAAVLKAKILDDESIPLVGINAKTINGIVTLSGDVKKSSSITAILKRVNTVDGVKHIISMLRVATV
ncbi:MAG: BON domain-containing protein [Legionellales bacterium]|nr:BON domain-containing protein [Legionellales bacterium]